MNVHSSQFTYSATSTEFVAGATPQDVFTLSGSATSNIYIMRMGIGTIQNASGVNAWFLSKRSTSNTGGTSSAPAIIKYNSNAPEASAVATQYTANPTGGTLSGYLWGSYLRSATIGSPNGLGAIEIDFSNTFGQPLCLLSASESIGFNFKGAATPAGLTIIAYAVWVEVSKT